MRRLLQVAARVERKSDRWLTAGHLIIYLHGWIIPTMPGENSAIDAAKLRAYRPSYRYLSYMLEGRGLPPRDDLPGIDRLELAERLARASRAADEGEMAWLENDAAVPTQPVTA